MSKLPGFTKFDSAKVDFSLLPGSALAQVAAVMQFGAVKYERDNWKQPDFDFQRCHAAALRHLHQWGEGQDNDPETDFSHLAHATCCLLFMLWHEVQGSGTDRRRTANDPSLVVHGLKEALERAAEIAGDR